jgi:lipid kinase, YegS/Rv2252/BmrU family
MRMMIIYNDTSGDNEGQQIAQQFKSYVAHKQDVSICITQVTNPDVDEKEIVKKAQENKIDTLVVIGGDGTVHHVVRMFQDTIDQYNIGLIPGGTVNNLARVLQLPLKVEQAFDVILTQEVRKIDYAKVNDDVMISTMTIGLLADTASKISQEEKQKYGPWAFMKRFFKLLLKKRQYALEIDAQERTWQGKIDLLTINMTNAVGGFQQFDASAKPDDGLMHVMLIPKLSGVHFIRNIPRILKGKLHEIPGIINFSAQQVTIRSLDSKKIGTRTDGDPTDELPVKLQVQSQGLHIFVPKE